MLVYRCCAGLPVLCGTVFCGTVPYWTVLCGSVLCRSHGTEERPNRSLSNGVEASSMIERDIVRRRPGARLAVSRRIVPVWCLCLRRDISTSPGSRDPLGTMLEPRALATFRSAPTGRAPCTESSLTPRLRAISLQQAEFHCKSDCPGAVAYSEFLESVKQVCLDRRLAQK